MPDYSKAVIYKIYDDEGTYYGSTVDYHNRKSYHKYMYSSCRSEEIITRGNWKMEIVEEFPCENRKELLTRERYYIENFPCVNHITPILFGDEAKERNKMHTKRYKANNKEQIAENSREYRKKNIEKIRKKTMEYRQKNIEKIRERQRKYDRWRKSFFGELCKMY